MAKSGDMPKIGGRRLRHEKEFESPKGLSHPKWTIGQMQESRDVQMPPNGNTRALRERVLNRGGEPSTMVGDESLSKATKYMNTPTFKTKTKGR